jgi:uncharacterized protein (DUF2147 family)
MILCLSLHVEAQVDDSNKIVGIWRIPGEDLLVKIDKIGSSYQGRIVWLKASLNEEAALDVHNPNEHLRNMPLKGNKILEELTFNPTNVSWEGGTYYSYAEGKLYNCRISLLAGGQMRVLKYTGKEEDGQVETWTRQ